MFQNFSHICQLTKQQDIKPKHEMLGTSAHTRRTLTHIYTHIDIGLWHIHIGLWYIQYMTIHRWCTHNTHTWWTHTEMMDSHDSFFALFFWICYFVLISNKIGMLWCFNFHWSVFYYKFPQWLNCNKTRLYTHTPPYKLQNKFRHCTTLSCPRGTFLSHIVASIILSWARERVSNIGPVKYWISQNKLSVCDCGRSETCDRCSRAMNDVVYKIELISRL